MAGSCAQNKVPPKMCRQCGIHSEPRTFAHTNEREVVIKATESGAAFKCATSCSQLLKGAGNCSVDPLWVIHHDCPCPWAAEHKKRDKVHPHGSTTKILLHTLQKTLGIQGSKPCEMGWPVCATTHAYVQKIPIQEAGPHKHKNDILQAVSMGKMRSFSALPITASSTSSATKVLSLLRIGLPITQVKRSAQLQSKSTKHDISSICEHTATKTSKDLLFRNEKKKRGGGGGCYSQPDLVVEPDLIDGRV